MKIVTERCVACGECVPYCPMGAIVEEGETVSIDADECVECEICQRADVCPTEALEMDELTWPRVLRNRFSNPLVSHPDTHVPGRGTEEMKTNDVTGRFRHGRAGMAVELGRPGIGSTFTDVERVARAVAKLGVSFEPLNPVTSLMVDKTTGQLQPEVLNEKVLSAIVEFEIPLEDVPRVLESLKAVSGEVNTVFSVDLISRVATDGSIPTIQAAQQVGWKPSANGKTCVGLGRPAAREEG